MCDESGTLNYDSIDYIISNNLDFSRTGSQLVLINSPQIKNLLDNDYHRVSSTLDYYKQLRLTSEKSTERNIVIMLSANDMAKLLQAAGSNGLNIKPMDKSGQLPEAPSSPQPQLPRVSQLPIIQLPPVGEPLELPRMVSLPQMGGLAKQVVEELDIKLLSEDGSYFPIRVNKDTSFGDIMKKYCLAKNVDINKMYFLHNGYIVNPNEITSDYGITNGEKIRVCSL